MTPAKEDLTEPDRAEVEARVPAALDETPIPRILLFGGAAVTDDTGATP